MELYDDQKRAFEELRERFAEGKLSPILVAPCGFGKTVVFSAIADSCYKKGNAVMICVHRQELLRQVCATLDQFNVRYGIISAGFPLSEGELVQVASIQTLYRRLNKIHYMPRLMIIDEAHHAVAPTFLKVIHHFRDTLLFAAGNNIQLLGVTATPCRSNGEGLDKVFDCIVLGADINDLIRRGRLAEPEYYAPPQKVNLDNLHTEQGDYNKKELSVRVDKPYITGDAIDHYTRMCYGKKAVVFCVSCKHAENVARSFCERGIPSINIDGSLAMEERVKRVEDFRAGRVMVLTSCELISEGFDLPSIEVAIMLRPTKSTAMWVQQAGRAIRSSPGKVKAIILDHVGNVFRHGLVEDIGDWSLAGVSKKYKDKEYVPSVRRCGNCFVVLRSGATVCHECGGKVELNEKELKQKEGELQKLERIQVQKNRENERKSARSFNELVRLGIERGYKSPYGWAMNVYNARQNRRRV